MSLKEKTIIVLLDSDENKKAEIKNIDEIKSLYELMTIAKTKLVLPDMDEAMFGFKTQFE